MFFIQSAWKCTFLFLMFTIIKTSWSKATTTIVPTKETFNCSQPPKMDNFDIGKCCRLPVINMGDAIEKCQKQIKSFKTYNDKFPIYAHVCYPECIYRETNTLKADGDIHMENIQKFLTTNVEQRDKIIVPTIVESFKTCMASIKRHIQGKGIEMFTKLNELDCSPYSSLVYGCVNTETFLHCPPEMWQQHESACNLAKSFAQQCNPLPHVTMPMI